MEKEFFMIKMVLKYMKVNFLNFFFMFLYNKLKFKLTKEMLK